MLLSGFEDDVQLDAKGLESKVDINGQNARKEVDTSATRATVHQWNSTGVVLPENGEPRLQLENKGRLQNQMHYVALDSQHTDYWTSEAYIADKVKHLM